MRKRLFFRRGLGLRVACGDFGGKFGWFDAPDPNSHALAHAKNPLEEPRPKPDLLDVYRVALPLQLLAGADNKILGFECLTRLPIKTDLKIGDKISILDFDLEIFGVIRLCGPIYA